MFTGKRDFLARCMHWSAATFLLDRLPPRNMLLVLVYHRIGNPNEDLFDPGVFSATGEQFSEQIRHLKRKVSLVTLEEAQAFVEGNLKDRTPQYRVLITFDDGYLDNYSVAFPILRAHDVQGVFFLSTGLIGSDAVPWWDEIAFLVKTARKRQFALRYPAEMRINLGKEELSGAIRKIMNLYKRTENEDPRRFIQELKEQTSAEDLPQTGRRFLNWDEAKSMIEGGMAIGSHCHSHSILSQLQAEQQDFELTHSRALLTEKLGIGIDSIAYPVGIKSSFSAGTQDLARAAGYRIGFSYYGGTNALGQSNTYNVKRTGVLAHHSSPRFKAQISFCRTTGIYWP